jgi:hypothetical protein
MTPAATQAVRHQVIAERVRDWSRDPRVSLIYYDDADAGQRAWFEVEGARVYPDVIVCLRDGRWIVEEVETGEGVREAEARKWHIYSKIQADEVHLLVPDRDFKNARRLTDSVRGIDLCGYTVVGNVVLFQGN